MQSSKVRSRLKAQLTKFSLELSKGRNFVGEMLFGIQASQDVKLSNIARSLKEEIPLIKTEDRSPLSEPEGRRTGRSSERAEDFVSENAEILEGVDRIRTSTVGRGIWAIDRVETASGC